MNKSNNLCSTITLLDTGTKRYQVNLQSLNEFVVKVNEIEDGLDVSFQLTLATKCLINHFKDSSIEQVRLLQALEDLFIHFLERET